MRNIEELHNITDDFISITEVAKFFQVARQTITRWETKGEFPQSFKIGAKHYYTKQEILDYLNQQMAKSQPSKD